MTDENLDILRCPACGGALDSGAGCLNCTGCDKEYPRTGAIPDLRLHPRVAILTDEAKTRLQQLSKDITDGDWRHEIREFLIDEQNNKDWASSLIAAGRYSWKLFLQLPESAVALDLRCGLGNLSHSLSPHVSKLYAMDLAVEALQFTEQRLTKFGAIDNVSMLLGGDGEMLPFADDSFDLVCLSGLLEQVPNNDRFCSPSGSPFQRLMKTISANYGEKNPTRTQKRFLLELSRILKPGGQLFIAEKNRYSHQTFSTMPADQPELPYGALMPRWAANAYSILKHNKPYRTYTYTGNGYRKLMKSANYTTCNLVGLYPGYKYLRELRPFDFERFCEAESPDRNFASRLKRSKAMCPAYGIIANTRSTQTDSGELLIDRLVKEILSRANLENVEYCTSQIFVTAKEKTVIQLRVNDLKLAIRLTWEEYTTDQERTNHHWLNQFKDSALKTVRLPKPVAEGRHQGIQYFSETWLDNETDGDNERDKEGDLVLLFGRCAETLAELRANGKTTTAPLKDNIYRRQIEIPLQSIATALGTNTASRIAEIISAVTANRTVQTGIRHGDFSATNFYCANHSAVPSLIDWEFGEHDGIVGLDEINYFDSLGRQLGYFDSVLACLQEIRDGMHSKLGQAFKTSFQRTWLNSHHDEANREDALNFLGTIYWLDHIGKQLQNSSRFNRKWMQNNIEKFVEFSNAQT